MKNSKIKIAHYSINSVLFCLIFFLFINFSLSLFAKNKEKTSKNILSTKSENSFDNSSIYTKPVLLEPTLPIEPKEPKFETTNSNQNNNSSKELLQEKLRKKFKPNLPNFSELRKKATKVTIQKNQDNEQNKQNNFTDVKYKYLIDFNLDAEEKKLKQLKYELDMASSTGKIEHAKYISELLEKQTQKFELLTQIKGLLQHNCSNRENATETQKLEELVKKLIELDPHIFSTVASNTYSTNFTTSLYNSSTASNIVTNLNNNENSDNIKNNSESYNEEPDKPETKESNNSRIFYKPSKISSFYLEIKNSLKNSSDSSNINFKKVEVSDEE